MIPEEPFAGKALLDAKCFKRGYLSEIFVPSGLAFLMINEPAILKKKNYFFLGPLDFSRW